MNLMHKQAQTEAELKRINDRLCKIFGDAGTKVIHTPTGIVEKKQDRNGNTVWILTGKAQ